MPRPDSRPPRAQFDPRPVKGAAHDHVLPPPPHLGGYVDGDFSLRPTIDTDAYEDDKVRHVPVITLIGPIKHWWTCWDSPYHRGYVLHRDNVRSKLIDAGYLTYAPWAAIKGTWSPLAQQINDAAIRISDLVVDLTPSGTPADGTRDEAEMALRLGIIVVGWTPANTAETVLACIEEFIGPGVQYE